MTVLSSKYPWSAALVVLLPLESQVQIPDFLQSDSRTKVFCTCVHTGPQTVTSSNWLDSYCCMRTQHMADSCPNSDHSSMHKLSAYPRESGSPFQFGHRSGDGKLN